MGDTPSRQGGCSVKRVLSYGPLALLLAALVTGCPDSHGGPSGNAVVNGTVTDAATGSPIAGVRVFALEAGTVTGSVPVGAPEVTTGADGIFEIQNAPSGKVDLLALPGDSVPYGKTTVRLTTDASTETSVAVRLVPRNVRVLSVDAQPRSLTLGSDQAQVFQATVKTTDGATYAPTWSVEGAIGTIDVSGTFIAGVPGQGAVRATLGTEAAVCSVIVTGCEIVPESDYIRPSDGAPAGFEVNDEGACEVIIGYVPAATRSQTWQAVDQLGGYVKRELRTANAVSAVVPPEAVERLYEDWRVAYVEPNYRCSILQAPAQQVVPWNVVNVGAPATWGSSDAAVHILPGRPAGEGVRVAIIDTGILSTHPDLDVAGGTNIINPRARPEDDHGHGTFAAGVVGARDNDIGIIGIAPKCDLYAVKALDNRGLGDIEDVIAGIDWCVDQSIRVINLSLGISNHSQAVKAACDAAWNGGKGAVLVAASGNNEPPVYPANYGSVISVGATDRSNYLAPFSSTGPPVELVAPGADVYSCTLNGRYGQNSGTSFSAPHIAGAAALLFSTGRYSDAAHVRQHLRNTALDLGAAGRDESFGYGRLDVKKAWGSLGCADVPIAR